MHARAAGLLRDRPASTPGARAASAVVSQEHLLPFLLNPKSYPHRPRSVRLVQTHASFVFIAPPFVFKVKKPVNFGFLNFSTLEKRRHFCEREVALNRRLSPSIYSAAMTEQTYDRLLASAEAQAKKGRGVILDATFARREHRELLAKQLGKRGMAWRVLEARAGNAAVKQRLRPREASPGEVSDARLEDFAMLTRLYEPPDELAAGQCAKVRTSGPLRQTVSKALQSLARIQVEFR